MCAKSNNSNAYKASKFSIWRMKFSANCKYYKLTKQPISGWIYFILFDESDKNVRV